MIAAHTDRATRILRVATATVIVLGAAALAWRPSLDAALPDEATGALVGDSVLPFSALPAARAGDAQRVIANNVFAASRRAPGRRYSPTQDVPTTSSGGGDASMTFEPPVAADLPSLLGTVLDALGDRALMMLPSIDSSARFYRVGERVGAYRVRRIEPGRVVLDGPNGRVVLELKPNEARP